MELLHTIMEIFTTIKCFIAYYPSNNFLFRFILLDLPLAQALPARDKMAGCVLGLWNQKAN